MTTNRNGQTLLASQPTQPEIIINQNYLIQGVIDAGVKSRTNGGPPGSPAEGDAYIVDAATGAWALGAVNDIAVYSGGGWLFLTPTGGILVNTPISVDDESLSGLQRVYWDGSSWLSIPAPGGVLTPVAAVGAAHALAQTDHDRMVVFDSASVGVITIPDGLLVGTQFTACNVGAGSVSITLGGADTLQGAASMAAANGVIGIMKVTATVWQSTERA